jgi:hypothetical protein
MTKLPIKPAILSAGAVILSFCAPRAFSADIPAMAPLFIYEESASGSRARLFGPLAERVSDEGGSVTAFRPVTSLETGASGSYSADFVWPFAGARDTWYEKFFWTPPFFCSSGKSGDFGRQFLFPLWISGTGEKGDFYWCVFPVYGEIQKIFGYDETHFVMFPLYWSAKRDGLSGRGFMWPFVNYDSAPGLERFRAAPFYASCRKEGCYEASAYMWPFFTRVVSLNPKDPGSGWMVWPLLGRKEWRGETSWSAVWPFFQTFSREGKGFGFHAPWPLLRFKQDIPNDGDFKLYMFPAGGYSRISGRSYGFAVWPCFSRLEDSGAGRELEWDWALPFYYDKNSTGGVTDEKYMRFWPFASWLKRDGKTVFRTLDLWPVRDMRAADRNWSPLWTFFSSESGSGSSRWDLLWGMAGASSEADGPGKFHISFLYQSSRAGEKLSGACDSSAEEFFDSAGGFGAFPEETADGKDGVSSFEFLCGAFKFSSGGEAGRSFRMFWLLEI